MKEKVSLEMDQQTAIERVTAALKEEGFGVITTIDAQATFREKIGKEFRPYTILGACNPALSYKVLTTLPEAGLLLPCNVVVETVTEGTVQVTFMDPTMMTAVLEHPVLAEIAAEADTRLHRAVETLRAITV